MTFTITEKAAERLLRIRWRKKAEGHVRIVAENRGGARWNFQMGFDVQRAGDEITESQGVTALMDQKTAKALDGMTMDFSLIGGKGTFTFTKSG